MISSDRATRGGRADGSSEPIIRVSVIRFAPGASWTEQCKRRLQIIGGKDRDGPLTVLVRLYNSRAQLSDA
jgi:hypothetical protein